MTVDVSDIVISLSGRDKGTAFFVTSVQDSMLLLCNGTTRRVDNPKRKNPKHVRFFAHCSAEKDLTNSEIRRALAECGAVDYS